MTKEQRRKYHEKWVKADETEKWNLAIEAAKNQIGAYCKKKHLSWTDDYMHDQIMDVVACIMRQAKRKPVADFSAFTYWCMVEVFWNKTRVFNNKVFDMDFEDEEKLDDVFGNYRFEEEEDGLTKKS